ncbi:MAG TPA: ABC transporter permease, partial [Blastocatellia bacterium]|nr:ABC transporter permease [Blastocatellia bacterium]
MLTWLAEFLRDIRFGVRHLARSPGFTSIAVLSLALGIMATTAIYSVIHAVVLDPFPYKDVDNLMSVKVWDPGQRGYRLGYSTDQFLEIAERNTIFEGVIASTISDVLWTDGGEPQRLRGNYGTFNTFQVMGVPPLIGRATAPDDARPDAAPVVVLGYRFWQRQFGGDPNVVGRQLRLNDKVRTVIGVMPKRFMWRGADVYLPVTFERGRVVEGVRGVHLLGRLKPGVTEAQAEVDLRPIIGDLKKIEPAQFPDNWRVGLLSFKETFPSSIRENLWILFGAVGLL